jgi:hypothetical protein
MRLRLLFALWLVFGSLATAQNEAKAHVRFFNDSAKAASFYLDGQFGCSIPANSQENNAYCDAEVAIGKHLVSVRGERLSSQSCELYAVGRNGAEPGAEAHLSKGEHFRCISYARD